MQDAPDRGAPSSLRGRLSDVYLPALVTRQADPLARRLGDRATVDDPIFGRGAGDAIGRYLEHASSWLFEHQGAFEAVAMTTGSDRDVTEGTLSLTVGGKRVHVPIAVVAERRPEREVAVRLYYSTVPIQGTRSVRPPLLPHDSEVALPPSIADHLDALARADVAALVASFEDGGTLRESSGQTYVREGDGSALRGFFTDLLGASVSSGAGVELRRAARADDGRTCALEYTVIRIGGVDVTPEPGLSVYERGESGLLHAVRVY